MTSDDDGGRAVAKDLGSAARYRSLDVRQEVDWIRVLEEVEAVDGRLNGLVNNAGITGIEDGPEAHDPEHADLADWHAVHRTNLDGVFPGCKHALRVMRSAVVDTAVVLRVDDGEREPVYLRSPVRMKHTRFQYGDRGQAGAEVAAEMSVAKLERRASASMGGAR